MNGQKLRPLLLPVGVAFFQSILKIFGRPGNAAPADILVGAFVSQQTGEFRSAMILAMENTLILVLFLIFYGDSVAAQQRTGAVYRFSRMADRRKWYAGQALTMLGWAAAYCGVYLACQGAVALTRTTLPDDGRFWPAAARVWCLMSLVTWLFGMLCSRLCGGLGAAVGIVGGALALILLSALATGAGQDPRILEWDPAGFPGECFTDQGVFLKKTGILLLEAAAVVGEAGRFFCRRDIFAAEGDG